MHAPLKCDVMTMHCRTMYTMPYLRMPKEHPTPPSQCTLPPNTPTAPTATTTKTPLTVAPKTTTTTMCRLQVQEHHARLRTHARSFRVFSCVCDCACDSRVSVGAIISISGRRRVARLVSAVRSVRRRRRLECVSCGEMRSRFIVRHV